MSVLRLSQYSPSQVVRKIVRPIIISGSVCVRSVECSRPGARYSEHIAPDGKDDEVGILRDGTLDDFDDFGAHRRALIGPEIPSRNRPSNVVRRTYQIIEPGALPIPGIGVDGIRYRCTIALNLLNLAERIEIEASHIVNDTVKSRRHCIPVEGPHDDLGAGVFCYEQGDVGRQRG